MSRTLAIVQIPPLGTKKKKKKPRLDDDSPFSFAPVPPQSRYLTRELAANYISSSTRTIDRLIDAGLLTVTHLPAAIAGGGANRRILIDRLELDEVMAAERESKTRKRGA